LIEETEHKLNMANLRFMVKSQRVLTLDPITGSRGTFEFQSQVNLSGPGLYCVTRSLTLNWTSRCNKVDAVRLSVKFTITKGSEVRAIYTHYLQSFCILYFILYCYTIQFEYLTNQVNYVLFLRIWMRAQNMTKNIPMQTGCTSLE